MNGEQSAVGKQLSAALSACVDALGYSRNAIALTEAHIGCHAMCPKGRVLEAIDGALALAKKSGVVPTHSANGEGVKSEQSAISSQPPATTTTMLQHYAFQSVKVGVAKIAIRAYRCKSCGSDFHIENCPHFCPQCGSQVVVTRAFGGGEAK